MITVKLVGGAKKLFSSDKLEVQGDGITISGLVDSLQNMIPENMPKLDPDNMLVAVNGVDSSALQGGGTLLHDGDVVSIIPLVHGGRSKRVQFVVMGANVELVRLKAVHDPVGFLDSLREKHGDVVIQGIKAQYVLNAVHVKKTVGISLAARESHTLLSNKIETDILMRFACTRQISDAISRVGVREGSDSILVVIGRKASLEKLYRDISGSLEGVVFSKDNSKLIKRDFGITSKQLGCIASKTPLEDLLAERSATLFH